MNDAMPDVPTAPPVLVDGRYRLGRRIGRGGCASVYVAEHRILHRPVAVKVAWASPDDDATQAERIIEEARCMAMVSHRHAMPVLDAGRIEHGAFLAMPLLGGGCLERRLERCRRATVREARQWMTQLAMALAGIHDAGLVHADIKPGNLLLDGSGAVVLADFGLARTPGIWPWPRCGSIGYMAPEQSADGGLVDPRADLYAMGCTWFHLLAGEAPLCGAGAADAVLAHGHDPRPDVRELRPEVDDGTAALIAQLMAIDPAGRPACARSALAAIHALPGLEAERAPCITDRILRLCRSRRSA
ncbi:MAG: serine/threonine protein kinase [Planctomycetes bacterium]|nr:serine/threonine protein kinase [Planctomycetota bacterium]